MPRIQVDGRISEQENRTLLVNICDLTEISMFGRSALVGSHCSRRNAASTTCARKALDRGLMRLYKSPEKSLNISRFRGK